jgi:hypothetical protein
MLIMCRKPAAGTEVLLAKRFVHPALVVHFSKEPPLLPHAPNWAGSNRMPGSAATSLTRLPWWTAPAIIVMTAASAARGPLLCVPGSTARQTRS